MSSSNQVDLAVSNLRSIANKLSAVDPLIAYEFKQNLDKIASSYVRISVVNPGITLFGERITQSIKLLESLENDLNSMLDGEDIKDIEKKMTEFQKDTDWMGKLSSVRTAGVKDFFKNLFKGRTKDEGSDFSGSYSIDPDQVVDGSKEWAQAESYIKDEAEENVEFFTAVKSVAEKMDELKKKPGRNSILKLREFVRGLIKQGKDIINNVRAHIKRAVPVSEDLEEDKVYAEKAKNVKVETDDEEKPKKGESSKPLLVKSTVNHYVDLLKENIDDEKKLTKILKEMFGAFKSVVASEKKARQEAQRALLPVLIKLATQRPSSRPVIVPILRSYLNA